MKRAVQPPSENSSRSGAIMVFALMALLLASLLIVGLLRTASMSYRQLKREEFRTQASLLADAGYARAVAMFQRQPEFTGDTWQIPTSQLTGGRAATVETKIVTESDHDNQQMLSVIAEYPVGHPDRVRVTRKVPIRSGT